VAEHVARDAELVLVEHEAQRPHRLDELDAQWPDAVVVDLRPQPPGQPDVVLSTVVAQTDEAVEHVVVLVQPYVGRQAHRSVEVAEADVVAVVPLRVAAGDPGEGGGDLVERMLVESDQHDGAPRDTNFS
jgi:hypothetical protein